MVITLETTVKDAVDSSPDAVKIFIRHGVDPREKCNGMYDLVTLDEAVDWCQIHDIDGLIDELNAALSRNTVEH